MTKKATNSQTLEALLSEVVEEMNASVIDDGQLAAINAEAHALSKRDSLTAELMLDGADEMDSVDGKLRDYYARERRHIGDLFRALAEQGKLPKDAADEMLDLCRGGVRANTTTGMREGKPFLEFVPVFDSPLSKAAYVLIQLSNEHAVGHRIVACKACGRLSLFQLGHKGRPREFCEGTNCGPNFHVATMRKKARRPARAAAKHK
jgi:hypothetical protein